MDAISRLNFSFNNTMTSTPIIDKIKSRKFETIVKEPHLVVLDHRNEFVSLMSGRERKSENKFKLSTAADGSTALHIEMSKSRSDLTLEGAKADSVEQLLQMDAVRSRTNVRQSLSAIKRNKPKRIIEKVCIPNVVEFAKAVSKQDYFSVHGYFVPIVNPNVVELVRDYRGRKVVAGQGRYGEVRLVRFNEQLCVVKKLSEDVSYKDYALEIEMMAMLNNTNATPKLLGIVTKDAKSRGDLLIQFVGCRRTYKTYTLEWLLDHGPVLEDPIWSDMCRDLCQKAHAIHRTHVVHCDIKPDNILLQPTARGHFIPYFIDLGLSQDARRHNFSITLEGENPKKYKEAHPYIAPELVNGKPFSFYSDIYAVGKVIQQVGKLKNISSLYTLSGHVIKAVAPEKRPTLEVLAAQISRLNKSEKWHDEKRSRSLVSLKTWSHLQTDPDRTGDVTVGRSRILKACACKKEEMPIKSKSF